MTDLIESEDELLDPEPGPATAADPARRWGTALNRIRERVRLGAADREADPARRRRRTLAGLLAVGIAAGAGATGAAVHSRDVTHALARTQDRTLLHLLGGTATLSLGGNEGLTESGTGGDISGGFTVSGNFKTALPTDFTISLRNDGAQPLEITGVWIEVPGVDVIKAPPRMTLSPGDSETLTARVAVHCTAPDLPRYPSGVTLSVRTPAAKGKAAGPVTKMALAFDAGHPVTATGSGSQNPDIFLSTGLDGALTPVTNSFYGLCGALLIFDPPRVSASALAGTPGQTPSPQNPVVSYTLHIDDSPDTPEMALPLSKSPAVPGVSAQTDLTAPRQIGSEGLDVTVSDRLTDCSAFGEYLTAQGGAMNAAAALNTATPVGLQPVDPRFQTTPTPLASTAQPVFDGLEPGTADLQETLLSQLAAVCPDL